MYAHIKIYVTYGKCSKFLTLFFSYSQLKCWLSVLKLTKCLSVEQTVKTLIRLLLQNQSDLSLHCLFRPFCQATCFRNFRTFTVISTHTLISIHLVLYGLFTLYQSSYRQVYKGMKIQGLLKDSCCFQGLKIYKKNTV